MGDRIPSVNGIVTTLGSMEPTGIDFEDFTPSEPNTSDRVVRSWGFGEVEEPVGVGKHCIPASAANVAPDCSWYLVRRSGAPATEP